MPIGQFIVLVIIGFALVCTLSGIEGELRKLVRLLDRQ